MDPHTQKHTHIRSMLILYTEFYRVTPWPLQRDEALHFRTFSNFSFCPLFILASSITVDARPPRSTTDLFFFNFNPPPIPTVGKEPTFLSARFHNFSSRFSAISKPPRHRLNTLSGLKFYPPVSFNNLLWTLSRSYLMEFIPLSVNIWTLKKWNRKALNFNYWSFVSSAI